MLDDAGDSVKPRGQRLGLRDRAKGAVEDQMAAVGDEGRADFFARRYLALKAKFARRRLDMQPRRPRAEAVDLDRQRKGAERFDALAGVGDEIIRSTPPRRFFREQRAAPPFISRSASSNSSAPSTVRSRLGQCPASRVESNARPGPASPRRSARKGVVPGRAEQIDEMRGGSRCRAPASCRAGRRSSPAAAAARLRWSGALVHALRA